MSHSLRTECLNINQIYLSNYLQMEKLIELLNEYEKKRIEKINSEWKLFVKLQFRPYTEESLTDKAYRSCWLEICSKYYGFIKWLVENDKIDLDAYKTVYSGDLDKRKTLTMSSGWDEFYQVTEHWVYESLLMLLSISDTPIEDLISYLK